MINAKEALKTLNQFQIVEITHDLESATVTVELVHEGGNLAKSWSFKNVRRFVIESPPFQLDSPYLIFDHSVELLTEGGQNYLNEVGYHHKKNGNAYVNPVDNVFRLEIAGDIYIELIFTELN